MGKIAPISRVLAEGDGWSVVDVVCTAGPRDSAFEERRSRFSIAVVMAGSFQYRSASGRVLMTPGSILLGNAEERFECGHDHGTGDRCVAFHFAPDYFERIASGAGGRAEFKAPRLPPLRATSQVIARVCSALAGSPACWEEVGIQLAARTVQLSHGLQPAPNSGPPSALARVTRAARFIERHPDAEVTLSRLAREARLSPYHFLRTFQSVTGVTPHQFVLRARLRAAALRLTSERSKVLDIALACGFRDLSNFNHAFRAEFGASPKAYRKLYFAIL